MRELSAHAFGRQAEKRFGFPIIYSCVPVVGSRVDTRTFQTLEGLRSTTLLMLLSCFRCRYCALAAPLLGPCLCRVASGLPLGRSPGGGYQRTMCTCMCVCTHERQNAVTGLQHRAHRQRELRLRGGAGSARLRHDQQVRTRGTDEKNEEPHDVPFLSLVVCLFFRSI